MSLRHIVVRSLLLTAVLAAACTSDRSPTNPVQTSNVSIVNFRFNPATVTVPVGSTVTWKNNDTVAHTSTSNAAGWDSGTLAAGASFSHTFTTRGSFAYHCAIHSSMTGTVTVQ